MMIWQWLLVVWTVFALVWWIMAVGLVAVGVRKAKPHNTQHHVEPLSITVFKALAGPLSEREFQHLSRCLESFIADLDDQSEMIIGCHDHDKARWLGFIDKMQQQYPKAMLKLVCDPDPRRFAANPKVSWMQLLTPHATSELWYWSDSDIEAPPGILQSLRADYASGNVEMVTSPYSIEQAPSGAALLDAMFVNLEFYPGVVLLSKMNAIEFGFGSGMLFKAESFRQRVDWTYLGSCLADDFHLGRLLQPVKLGSTRLTTTPASESWRGALSHYLRWQKTIRWNRPGGFGAQLLVLPLLGWLVALALMPGVTFVWWGLAITLALDLVAAILICRLLHCHIGLLRLPVIPLWSIVRCLTWLACWLPLPIVWRGRKWWSAYQTIDAPVTPAPSQRTDME